MLGRSGRAVRGANPAIQSLSPATAAPGAGPIILTVTGSGFVESSIVEWNGDARPTTYVNAANLTATISPSDLLPGTFAVTVVTPAPGGGSSAALQFAVPAPVPTLSSLSRASAGASDSTLQLTVSGSGFAPVSVVRWGAVELPTVYAGATTLVATLGVEQLGADAVVPVDVFTPAPGGGTSAGLDFRVTPTVLELYLPTNDLVYHSASGLIWASVPGTGGDQANTLTAIDPRTGELVTSVPIGDEPGSSRSPTTAPPSTWASTAPARCGDSTWRRGYRAPPSRSGAGRSAPAWPKTSRSRQVSRGRWRSRCDSRA